MRLGIVGSESAKFTPQTRDIAFHEIRKAVFQYGATSVVSGGCHLGGIDIWAERVAEEMSLPMVVHKPESLTWQDKGAKKGFMTRNLEIVRDSDLVLCITLRELPLSYRGMRFEGCYHCKDRIPPHVKSGGCWTAWQAPRREWIII